MIAEHNFKLGDLIRWLDYTVEPPKTFVGLYVGDITNKNITCWQDIYLLVGFNKMKVCSWQCEVLNG